MPDSAPKRNVSPASLANLRMGGGRPLGVATKNTNAARTLAGEYGPDAIAKLGEIIRTSTDEKSVISASREILDRWVGRPPQAITDADGGNLPTVPQIVTYLLSVQPSSSQVDTLRLNP